MRKMQEFAPEVQKLKAKYGNDRQKLAAETQKLQSQQGVNPLGGCLPVLVQVPVFIGLFHVLREFKPGKTENYIFGPSEVESFNAASLFGAKLGAWVTMGQQELEALGTSITSMFHGEPLARATGPSARRSNRPEPRRPEPARSQVSGEHHAAAPPRPPPGRRRADLPRRRGVRAPDQGNPGARTEVQRPRRRARRATRCPMACVPARAVRDTRNHRYV